METELRAFFWGRTLPEKYRYINLSNLSIEDIAILKELRNMIFEANRLGIDLGWGKQLTIEDLR